MSQNPSAFAPDAALPVPAHEPAAHASPNQFALLRQRRFAPFFWTQFAGAANDNLFKFAFTVMVTYQLSVGWLPPAMAGLVIGALFILPFLLFSATSGQLTDKYDKTTMIRLVKNLEIGIMALAAWAFMAANVPVLLGCVFLMGLHSTLFGPVKFAYLPQVLNERELTGGNGMVEMGTFVAILLGNVVGGLLVAMPQVGHASVAIACVALALAGRAVAQFIPSAPATDPGLKINWNPVTETWRNLKLAHGNVVVFRSMLGISWMWFFGAVFLSNFPAFAKEVLHGNEQVASLLLVVFSIGIGVGSLLCEKLSHRHVEIGLVPLGAIGMTVFSVDLYFASRALPAAAGTTFPLPASALGTPLPSVAERVGLWRLAPSSPAVTSRRSPSPSTTPTADKAPASAPPTLAAEKRAERLKAQEQTTVAALAQAWYDRHIAKTYKHPEVVLRVLRRHIEPVIGKLGVTEVRPLHIDKVLTRILDAGAPTVANDALRHLFRMFHFAVKRRWIDANPVSGFEISDAGGFEVSRQRWLNREELAAFAKAMQDTPNFGRQNELAVWLLLALCVRKMELLSARWTEFDLERGVWALHPSRTKMNQSIDISLAAPVLRWLQPST